MSSNVERMKKLYALALRGVGGEKEQAAAILEKLVKKYGVSMEDLDEEIVREHEFSFHGDTEERLLRQIAYKVTNERNTFLNLRYTQSGRACRTRCRVKCTDAQKIEIEFLFDFYKKLWERELEIMFKAYIHKHSLFGDLKPGEKGSEISDEEWEKICTMARGLSSEKPILQLTEGGSGK